MKCNTMSTTLKAFDRDTVYFSIIMYIYELSLKKSADEKKMRKTMWWFREELRFRRKKIRLSEHVYKQRARS